jgi:DUF971 family protein
MKPIKITVLQGGFISILWIDGHESEYKIEFFRDNCPCASCQGETVLFKSYSPEKYNYPDPGKYDLTNILTVGNYAIQATWGDGHDAGIYSWDYLRKLCQCENCRIK